MSALTASAPSGVDAPRLWRGLLERIAAAMAREEASKVLELVQELRLYDLESWAEKA